MKRRIYLLNSLAATLLLTGCMGYKLGGSRPEGIERVTMGPVINRTTEPAIELSVSHAMRQRIQFDGRLKLAEQPKHADATINVVLTRYSLSPIAYRSDRTETTPNLYRLRITGKATLVNQRTGEVLANSNTYGESTFEFQSDLTSSKRDALPRAAREIAKFMVDDLIEQW